MPIYLKSPRSFTTLVASSLLLFLPIRVPAQTEQSDEFSVPALDSVRGQGAATSAIPPGGGRLGGNYVIGPEDLLHVEVFGLPELTSDVRVANDGSISLPLLGYVRAVGYTVQQLRAELQSQWGKSYLQNPQVSIFVREFHAQPVSVVGAVEKPGIYQLVGPRNLVEVISMAGGLARMGENVPGSTIVIARKDGFGNLQPVEGMRLTSPEKLEVSIPRLLYEQDQALNIEVKPFDIITVSKADVVFVVGAVKKPGRIALGDTTRPTVLQAIAVAGGLESTAAKRSAQIIRKSADGSRVEIPLDLGKVLKGKSQDVELAVNDILFVPDSTSKAAGKRGFDAALQTISGVLIFHAGRY